MKVINQASAWAKAGTVAALVLGAIGLPSPGHASGAPTPTPTEVAVIPAGIPTAAPMDSIVYVGVTGYLHRRDNGGGFLWTRFSDGQTSTVAALSGTSVTSPWFRNAGGDSVYVYAAGTARLINLADQSVRSLPVPAGFSPLAANGTTFLMRTNTSPQTLELIKYADDNSTTTTPVTGTAGETSFGQAPTWVANTSNALILGSGACACNFLVDFTTGLATAMPTPRLNYVAMDSDHVVGSYPGSLLVYSRPGLLDGANKTPLTLHYPTMSNPRFAVVGNHVIVADSVTPGPVYDLPMDGSTPRTLYKYSKAVGAVLGGPDGGALAFAANIYTDWSAHRLSADTSGNLVDDASLRITNQVANAGISFSFGVVRHVESSTNTLGVAAYTSFDQALALYPGEISGRVNGVGGFTTGAMTCQTGVNCLRLMSGNYYGPMYLLNTGGLGFEVTGGGEAYSQALADWGTSARITDVSGYFAIVNSTSRAKQMVISTAMNQVLSTGPLAAAALWGSTIWQPTSLQAHAGTTTGTTPTSGTSDTNSIGAYVAGSITGTDLDWTPAPKQTVQIGSPCIPSELQADNTWIYWSCGAGGPAGAHNLTTGANVVLPPGKALLGDGYVVIQTPGEGTLKLYGFATGSVADAVTIGAVPAGPVTDDRQFSWTVDKNGGDIAYVDSNDSVHVIDPGVARTGAVVTYAYTDEDLGPRVNHPAQLTFWMNRPIESWALTIKSAVTGAAVRTITGAASREYVNTSWDGKADNGVLLPSGDYHWTLTTSTADGPGRPYSGTTTVLCGAYVFRSYDCVGQPAFIAVNDAADQGDWFIDTATNTLSPAYGDGSWLSWDTSAIIPWGDYNGDGNGDLLARDKSGTLRAYLGIGQLGFSSDQIKSVQIGTGWQAYSKLLTTGDINGDGIFDMIARDQTGVLYMYPGRPSGGLGARVKIGSGWNTFKQIVGVGDITGDGKADLVTLDGNGVLSRYSGTGNSGFASRVTIGTGWSGYTTLIGIGDFNHDGRNDLIGKDSSGTLWLFPGTGSGGFAARAKIGTGFNTYSRMY